MPDLGKATYTLAAEDRRFSQSLRRMKKESSTANRSMTRDFDKTDKKIQDTDRSMNSLSRSMLHFNRTATTARNVISLFKWPAMIVGVGLAAQAVSALTAAVLALSGALGPLTGALVAYPGILAAVAQGIAAVKLGFSGLSDVMKAKDWEALKEATKGWSGEARRAALGIRKLLKPAMEDLKNSVRDEVLPRAFIALRKVLQADFPIIKRVLTDTGKVMGNLAIQTAEMFATKAWQRDIGRLGKSNAAVLEDMGTGILGLVDALRHVLVAARPFIRWISKGIEQFGLWASDAALAGRETGKLGDFFDRTKRSIKLLWGVLKPFGTALFNIIKLGKPLGDTILKDLGDAAEKFQEWTESAKGENAIKKWFDDSKPGIYEMGRLLRDVVKMFGRLGANKGIADVFKQIRTDLLPVLEDVIANTTEAFGPHLVDALVEFARLFGQIVGHSGPLIVMTDALGGFAGFLADLLENNPELNKLVVNFIGLAGALKLVGFFLLPIKFIFGSTILLNLARLTKAIWLLRGATLAQATATWAVTIPLTLTVGVVAGVVLALIALGAAFVILYKKNETFRKIVDATWKFIKKVLNFALDHWEFVLAAMTGGFGLAVAKIIQHRDEIIGAIRFLLGKVKTIFFTIKNAIVDAWEWVDTKSEEVWRNIYNTIAIWLNKVIGAINWVLDKLGISEIGTVDLQVGPARPVQSERVTARAQGGLMTAVPGGHLYRTAEQGKGEMVIPLDGKHRDRAWGLLEHTAGLLRGEKMGGPRGDKTGGPGASWDALNPAIRNFAGGIARRFGLVLTSGVRESVTRSGARSLHAIGAAADIAGPVSNMNAAAAFINSSGAYRALAEGIYALGGYLSVSGGSQVSPSFWGSATWADHRDHLHLAITGGGDGGGGIGGFLGGIWDSVKDFVADFTDRLPDIPKLGMPFMTDILKAVAGKIIDWGKGKAKDVAGSFLPFMGDGLGIYHKGGIVPGRSTQPILVRGGEGVFTREQMEAMGNGEGSMSGSITITNWDEGIGWFEGQIENSISAREDFAGRRGRVR